MKKLLIVAAIAGIVWLVSKNAGGNSPGAEALDATPGAAAPAVATPDANAAALAQRVATVEATASSAASQVATATDSDPATAARDDVAALLLGELPVETRKRLMAKLDALNETLVFSPKATRYSTTRVIKAGDTLLDIGTECGQGLGLLMKMNRIQHAADLRSGQTIKILNGRTRILVDKSQFTLSLFAGDQLIKQYLIGTGINNSSPVGEFVIATKMRNPDYRGMSPDDPRNPLGTRWMGFAGEFRQYGIHGTREPEKIPGECSKGCVRMVNAQVEELMEFVTYKAHVVIQP